MPAMNFIGGGASNYRSWFDFMGLLKDKRPLPVGSPFQQNFRVAGGADDVRPEGFSGSLDGDMAGCGDNALRCSCSDCPSGAGCEAPVRGS
jgi:Niemann-Pick C1 protein